MKKPADDLIAADKQCLWHPFTPGQIWLDSGDEPARLIVEAQGFRLIDSRGDSFIDGFSSLWCNLHGHRVPQIDAAIRAQLEKVSHTTLLGHASGPSIELGRRLVQHAPPGLARVFYSDSGATAVEVALKMAYQYWLNRGRPRRRFMALQHGYHGDTIGAVSVGGIDSFHQIFRPMLFETTLMPSPCPYVHPLGASAVPAVLEQIEQALAAAPEEYCAMIVEPLVQGAGGMLTHGEGFLAGVREITRRHDVLLIVDEVATGFCRTGRLFACENEDVAPDLMCLGKGLSGGYLPLAATLATREIFDAFSDGGDKTFFHGHTFTGNALACAAGVASFDLIFSSGLLDTLSAKEELIARRLGELADHPHVAEVRQRGMMVGVQLVQDRAARQEFDPALRTGAGVCMHARRHGVLTRPLGDVVVLMPAPAMDLATLDELLKATVTSIREYFDGTRI
ncbi:MAG: adenosylmethionine--8-amino-7-oxononanoate transaminase [Planctomycetaceae bacterium]|nr:adenosylmethionine--8-amino-7-oxononanoate transaminase [Planctomycetaceae bacterium]